MITVEVYSMGTEDFVATLSSSEKGKKCTIDAFDASVKSELEQFVNTILSLPKRGRAYPEDRQAWMEALPVAKVSVPYWFKIAEPTSKIIEEVDDDNESIEEVNGEEEADNGGDATGDGDDSDDGGDLNSDGGNADGGYDNRNG